MGLGCAPVPVFGELPLLLFLCCSPEICDKQGVFWEWDEAGGDVVERYSVDSKMFTWGLCVCVESVVACSPEECCGCTHSVMLTQRLWGGPVVECSPWGLLGLGVVEWGYRTWKAVDQPCFAYGPFISRLCLSSLYLHLCFICGKSLPMATFSLGAASLALPTTHQTTHHLTSLYKAKIE